MESYMCCPTDLALLLGEGNFSFSRDFLDLNKGNNFPSSNLYSTCYESNTEEFSPVKVGNLEALKSAGVNVLFNIDATQISKDPKLNNVKFTKFIFNFPHTGGKMKINQCRNLLQLFFQECKQLIVGSDEHFSSLGSPQRDHYRQCEVIVPLCKGQGGTIFDESRKWEDTWKVVEMAAHADFVLSNVEYFNTKTLNHYSSIGFRSREQHFNTVKGIIHVFKLSLHPELNKYDTWVDLYQGTDSEIGLLMDMKQTSVLTNSIFSGFKDLFSEAVNLFKGTENGLEFETTFIIRKGFRSAPPQYPPLDPNRIYDLRTCHDPLRLNDFKKHPVEYKYISDNSRFKTICLSFLKDICDKINKSSRVIGTNLPVEGIIPNNRKQFDQHFLVFDEGGSMGIQNNVNDTTEIVFETYAPDECEHVDNSGVKSKYVFHLQKVAQFLSCSDNWKIIFSHQNFITINNGILSFHFAHLSPVEYTFDINFTVKTDDYCHDKFFACLWYIIPEMIENVLLVNEHQNPLEPYKSYLFRIWYKSYDRPLYRKKVIDIHQNVVGKHLHSMLGVMID